MPLSYPLTIHWSKNAVLSWSKRRYHTVKVAFTQHKNAVSSTRKRRFHDVNMVFSLCKYGVYLS